MHLERHLRGVMDRSSVYIGVGELDFIWQWERKSESA
jgi:hypothetical protein